MTFPIDPNSNKVIIAGGLIVDDDLVGLPLADGNNLASADSFAVCRICGAIYVAEMEFQVQWLDSHNDLHTPQEHYELEISNRAVTTDAFTALERIGLQGVVGVLR